MVFPQFLTRSGSLCLEEYSEQPLRCPRKLPCGPTFCTGCRSSTVLVSSRRRSSWAALLVEPRVAECRRPERRRAAAGAPGRLRPAGRAVALGCWHTRRSTWCWRPRRRVRRLSNRFGHWSGRSAALWQWRVACMGLVATTLLSGDCCERVRGSHQVRQSQVKE